MLGLCTPFATALSWATPQKPPTAEPHMAAPLQHDSQNLKRKVTCWSKGCGCQYWANFSAGRQTAEQSKGYNFAEEPVCVNLARALMICDGRCCSKKQKAILLGVAGWEGACLMASRQVLRRRWVFSSATARAACSLVGAPCVTCCSSTAPACQQLSAGVPDCLTTL